MRKAVLLFMVGGLLLTAAISGQGAASSSSQSVNVSTPINSVIENYFTSYFDAEKTLSYSKMSSMTIADTESTQLNEAFREKALTEKRLLNCGISNYQYDINYQKCSVSGETTKIKLKLDLEFQYKKASSDIKSAVNGVTYTFTLKNNGSRMVITGIDSDLMEFEAFKVQVAKKASQNSLTQSQAANQVKTTGMNNVTKMVQNSLAMKGSTSGITSGTSTSLSTAIKERIGASTDPTYNIYSYSADDAVAYATAYATASSKSRIFYTASGLDCTNFISQCVWAGFIGYSSAKASAVKSKTGMVPSVWFAGTGGGATKWENVKAFYTYITDDRKSSGPLAMGYNDGRSYTGVSVSDINVGDILQFTGDSVKHSVIVTGKESVVYDYSDIYVSYHSSDVLNGSLATLITWAKGTNTDGVCYMRRIVPTLGTMK